MQKDDVHWRTPLVGGFNMRMAEKLNKNRKT